jgi:hypothetical protein
METKKILILVFLAGIIGIIFSLGCIQVDIKKDACESSGDCILAYTGDKPCAPCDLKDPEIECVTKENAAQLEEQRRQKWGYVKCSPCPPISVNFSCECHKGRCRKPRFIKVTEEESKEIAKNFIENSETYKFDGFELKHKETIIARCPYCWLFKFEFKSKHAGYGDRTGKILVQVITPHTASIVVQEGKVSSAILDGKWDMIKQEFLEIREEKGPSLELSKDSYVLGEKVTFTFDPGTEGDVYTGGFGTLDNWLVYKKSGDEKWELIRTGALFGCRAIGCENGVILKECVDFIIGKCHKIDKKISSSWNQKYWFKENRTCGNSTYELRVYKQVEPGRYKIRYKYALKFGDPECKDFKFLEKEFTIEAKEKESSPSPCSLDIDCAQAKTKCADGVDPYHVCKDGKCVELNFIRDPCLDHICPKGNWNIQTDKTCLHYENCSEKECDDHSETTIDKCVGIGTRSEGCLYTIVEDNKGVGEKYSCNKDSDCVPEQCCHPTSCVNKDFKPNCEGILCSMICEGPIDCGAGRCACVDNKCKVEKLKK